jgi:hypothetical protein
MSLWIMLDDSLATDELLAGARAAAIAALVAEAAGYQAATRFRMRPGWGDLAAGVAAFELITAVVVMVLAQAFQRPGPTAARSARATSARWLGACIRMPAHRPVKRCRTSELRPYR